MKRGNEQMNGLNLPMDGDIILDVDGREWTVKMTGGFMLRSGGECHPDFVAGPMDWLVFCQWFNEVLQ